jgi:DNA-binding NtrC family response regulator
MENRVCYDSNEKASSLGFNQYRRNGESVLVVDDMADIREALQCMLNLLGYRVNSVSSGEEAVEYIRNNKADIILLDMMMDPGMDGLDTYRLISQINPGQKAIIISGYAPSQRVSEARRLGVGDFVEKPCKMEKLGLAMRRELDRK